MKYQPRCAHHGQSILKDGKATCSFCNWERPYVPEEEDD